MKPKQRKQQKQTSRLYLRRKDHRECIMNNAYHNAIWMKKTKSDGTVQDELAWLKYPKRHALFYTKFYYGYYTASWGYFDIDRQFAFGTSRGGSISTKVVALEDYAVIVQSYSTTDIRISKDGIVYKNKSFSNYRHNMQRFGENALVYWWQDGTTLGYRTMDIVDFDDNFRINEVTHTSTTVQSYWEPVYVCETDEGCIVAYHSYSNETLVFYELTRAGAVRLNDVAIVDVHDSFSGSHKFGARGDDFYCVCNCEVWRNSISVPFNYDFCVYYSNDKTTWNKVTLYRDTDDISYSDKGMFCVNRGLYTYFYCMHNGNMRIFKTMSGATFQEIETSSSLMISAINSGGMGVANSGYNTIQIKLKENAVSSGDYQFSCSSIEFDSLKDGWSETYFEDGKLEKHEGFLSFIIKKGSGSDVSYCQVILDNNEFESSDDNVFFQHGIYSAPSGTNLADKVINGDYVL